jgi:hypothetical protein
MSGYGEKLSRKWQRKIIAISPCVLKQKKEIYLS